MSVRNKKLAQLAVPLYEMEIYFSGVSNNGRQAVAIT